MTVTGHLSIDIETYSSVDIKKAGLYRYVQSPDFEVLLFACSQDGASVEITDLTKPGETIDRRILQALFDPQVVKHAYNATFEWYCLSKLLGLADEQRSAWISQWQCTMFHGLYCGYTAGLGATGEAIGLPQDKRKLGTGRGLINTFCKPCKPTRTNGGRTRTLPAHEPERWQLFKGYCIQDVVTEMEIERRLSAFPVPENEQRLWQLDQLINAFGVAVDMPLVHGAIDLGKTVSKQLTDEAVTISGIENPKSVKQLSDWLEEELEEEIEDLRKSTVKDMLEKDLDSDKARRMLEIRQELGKTSTKKYDAIAQSVCADNRVRGLLQFYGANRTGRWAGRLVQVQNLPRNYISTLTHARELVKERNLEGLRFCHGSIPDTLSQLIRTAFVPAPGCRFVVADFSAIEARVISWLAKETWRQEVFRTHGKIYEASASAMFGVPIETIAKGGENYDLRQRGKVAELALGYQGGSGALIKMGALEKGLAETELPEIVSKWRRANKRIVDMWYAFENAAIEVIRTGRPESSHGVMFAREIDYATDQDFLTVALPSGRKLFYAHPYLGINSWGQDSIRYYGVNQTSKKWVELETYGGKLTENVVQAIARDCLAVAMERLTAAGYKIVMHIHDEVVIEAPAESANLDAACAVMSQPIPWAPGLLLRADGFIGDYYKK